MQKIVQSAKAQGSQTAEASTALQFQSVRPMQPQSPMARMQHAYGNQRMQRVLGGRCLQRKLTVNQPGDAYEQEADRVADIVMRMPDSAADLRSPGVTSLSSISTLRRCSCGQSSSSGECEECKAKGSLQRSCSAASTSTEAPPIVHEVLRSPGQPLDQATRNFMEPRFGHDFSNVRVHTDARAAESARAVGALAYTVGNEIVLGSERQSEAVATRVLAHELTHVIQQGNGGAHHTIQRACHGSVPTTPGCELDPSITPPSTRFLFNVNCDDFAPSTDPRFPTEEDRLADVVSHLAPGTAVEVVGLASFDGPPDLNQRLACRRRDLGAAVIRRSAPAGVTVSSVHATVGGPSTAHDRNMRAVGLNISAPPPPPPTQPTPPTPAERICGPDITTSLTTMLGTVEPWFRTLTGFQQDRSCAGLGPAGFLVGVNPVMAWDTRELFLPNTGWLDAYFVSSTCGSPRDPGCPSDPTRHLCETSGSCGNSVVVGGKCMLAGTANYALFGKMCRLCHDYTGRWNRWDMRAIIGLWKTIDSDDPAPPREVASAAYDGTFPTVPAAAENRGTCTGRCGRTHGGSFDFIWEPYKPR